MPIANRTCVDCGQKKPQTEMKQVERKSGRSGISASFSMISKRVSSVNSGRNYYRKVWVCKGWFKCGKPSLAERKEEAGEQRIVEDNEHEETIEAWAEEERIEKEKEKKIAEEKYQTWATQNEYEPNDKETRIEYTKYENVQSGERSIAWCFILLTPFFLALTENMLEIKNVIPIGWDDGLGGWTIAGYIVLPFIVAGANGLLDDTPFHEKHYAKKFNKYFNINCLMLFYIFILFYNLGSDVFWGLEKTTEKTSDGNTSVQSANKNKESTEANSNDNASVQSTNKDKESTEATSNDNTSVQSKIISAEQGNASAQNNLGGMYEFGDGVTQDYAEAVKWYRKAAEQGNANAHYNLGTMYESGDGVTQDYAEAVKWYRKGAEQGNASAQYRLGTMYINGMGVTQDDAEAVKWYTKAAEQEEYEFFLDDEKKEIEEYLLKEKLK
jgi:hypothetical protein